jgi:hypothetical protein
MKVSKLIERKSDTTHWASSKRVQRSNYDKQLHLSSPETSGHAVRLLNHCPNKVFTTRFCTCGLWVETRLNLCVAVSLLCVIETRMTFVRCQILTAVITTIIMWDVKPFSLVDWYQRFGGICCLFLLGRKWRQHWQLSTN